MSWALLAHFAQHGETKPAPNKARPYTSAEYRLVGGEVITAPDAETDPRNIHKLKAKSLRKRLQKRTLTEEELFAAPGRK